MFAAHSPRPLPALLAAALVALAGLALVTGAAPGPTRAADHAVTIADFAFAPAELTVSVGDTVTWTNLDPVAHTATSTTGAFDSDDLEQGESYAFTFTTPGTYDYLCTPHPSMTARIVVVEAIAPAPSPTQPAAAAPTPAPTAGQTGPLPDVRMEEPRADWMTPVGVVLLALAALIAVGGSIRRAFARRRRA